MNQRRFLQFTIGLIAASVLAAVAAVVSAAELGPTTIIIGAITLEVVSAGVSHRLQRRGDVELWRPDAAVLAAAALLLPAAGIVTVFAVGGVLGGMIGRPRRVALAFNSAQVTLAAAAAATAARAIHPDWMSISGQSFVAAVAAVLVFVITNEVVYSLLQRVAARRPFGSTFLEGLRLAGVAVPLLAALGCLVGASASAFELAIFFGLVPMIGAQVVIGEMHKAKGDRERLAGLLSATIAAHSTIRTGHVVTALAEAAKTLLNCDEADLVADAPAEGALSARLPMRDGTDRWLVVKGRDTGAELDADDRHLLEAISAIGATALENARLVEEIERQALHDPLTGLANQLLFEDRVNRAAAAARLNRERFAVAVLDVDGFKRINDSLGHTIGNELLRLIGDRILGVARELDTVARLGADHFTLLLHGVGGPDMASVMAEKLLSAVRRPLNLGGHELFMTASIGIAFFPEDGGRSENLLRNADSAMHRAKEVGRNTYQIYSAGMNDMAHLRLFRESELHAAIERSELRVRYQPQVDLRSGRIIGAEALVRWDHPVLGLLGPAEFVPLAEESGLIVDLDEWVLLEACRQAKRWIDEGLPALQVAVNISGRHFQLGDRLYGALIRVLDQTGLDPDQLELEVTESIAVSEADDTARMLNRIRQLGVRLAIDDFGTGYSMLGRLRQFPIDRLKIDRTFVNEIQDARNEAPIIAAMIAMGRSLRIEVCAEGVETLEQLTFLKEHGCDQAQGFLFSHPVEAEDLSRLVTTGSIGMTLSPLLP